MICYLTNDDLNSGYTAYQVGVYATDPDEGEILFFIAQAMTNKGTEIPSSTEMPGYSAEWSFYFSYGQADGVEVTVDPSNAVSVKMFEEHTTDENNPHKVTAKQVGALPDDIVPPTKGGTGKNNAADGFTVLTRRDSVGNTNLVNADTLTTPGIHQVYFEGSTYNPADYNYPYAYGVLVVSSTVSYVGQLFYAVSANKLWYRTRATTSSVWGSWCKLYDTNNKPTLEDLGAAASNSHNIKTYTNLSQLGLSNGATMSQVARALPGSSMLRIYVLTSENSNLAPSATNGWLEVSRPATNHAEFHYATSAGKIYFATVLNIGKDNEQVSGWTQIANKSDLDAMTPNSLGVPTLLAGTSIPKDANLDSYIEPGNYCCIQSDTASSLINCPTFNAFNMKVFYANGSNYYIAQELTDYSTGVRYYRLYIKTSGTWQDWKTTYSTANITSGTTDLVAGESKLETGKLYFVYE